MKNKPPTKILLYDFTNDKNIPLTERDSGFIVDYFPETNQIRLSYMNEYNFWDEKYLDADIFKI